MTEDERREKERLRHRVAKRKLAAEKAVAEGREPNLDFDRPKAPLLTDEEKRERRRIKQSRWRANNLEKARGIVRESERRRAAKRAIAAGRVPGRKGPPVKFTEEEKRAKRKAKSEKWNTTHLEDVREKAKLRGRALRAGTFVSKALPRLTDEERKLVNRAMSANRRARLRENGGKFTREDIAQILVAQNHLCRMCAKPFGEDGFHIDHWIPIILGGANDPSNLALLHPFCNLTKGARHPDELNLTHEGSCQKGD